MYELFDHTADIGLRIRGGDLNELFSEAARALFSVIVANLDVVKPVEQKAFEIDGGDEDDEDYENLLHDWLTELLYTFHVEHRVFSQFEVHIAADKLTATAGGERIDETRHELDAEIKAITYHGLKVEKQDHGWLAEVIIDI